MSIIIIFFQHFVNVFLQSAPWLLLGFFIAGIIKVLIPNDFLHRHLGGDNILAVVKGAILGAPIPLCSCGVIPAALGLRRAGASKAATTSFLIATPETGVDSVSITYALLGPFMAIIRPIAAITTAIAAGIAVMLKGHTISTAPSQTQSAERSSATTVACCSSAKVEKATQPVADSSCCSSQEKDASSQVTPSLATKLRAGLTFTFVDLVKDTSIWLLIGLAMAAVIMTVVPASFLQQWGASPYAYLVMALIGVPMYICATASTPIAAGLLFAGVSPGAILVFLLVGPATNIATIVMVKKELGNKVLWIYLSTIIFMGFVFGWLTDWLNQQLGVVTVTQAVHEHAMPTSPVVVVSAIIFLLLLVNGLRKRLAET